LTFFIIYAIVKCSGNGGKMRINEESINAFMANILRSAYEDKAYEVRFEKGKKSVIAIVNTRQGTTRHFYRGQDSVWLILAKFFRYCREGIVSIFRKNRENQLFKLSYDPKGLTLTRM